jgi:hypothetical protein
MKIVLMMTALLVSSKIFAQTTTEAEIIKLSNDKFRWEMHNDADSMAPILDDGFVGISSAGVKRNKREYLANIKDTATVHNSMDIKETSVSVYGTTAILTGSGLFVITANNKKATLHLSYMQVFIKRKNGWKMVALQGSRLAD